MILKAFFSHLICGICVSHHVSSRSFPELVGENGLHIAKNGTRNLSVDISLTEMGETNCYEVREFAYIASLQ